MKRSHSFALVALGTVVPLFIATGDVSSARATATLQSVRIDKVPHVRQKPDFCGEACLEMYVRKLGVNDIDQDYVFDISDVPPSAGRGCWTRELAAVAGKLGFDVGNVWYRVPTDKLAAGATEQFKALHTDLVAGRASIVCMRTGPGAGATEHFRLILGYDAKTDEVLYHEPAAAAGAYRRMKRKVLLDLWPLNSTGRTRTIVRLRLAANRIQRPARPSLGGRFTRADFAQHVLRLKKRLPAGGGFTVTIQPPFVVIGDERPNRVRGRARSTVKWAVDHLKKDYFPKDPAKILDIWLFKDKASYLKHTKSIFGHTPSTPYGYYSSSAGALIMNIRTGGGTLVHEIVHPFMAANFPNCPPWLNEGLGSLYEQSEERNGRIYGAVNWRLPGLQKQIRSGSLPTFEKLMAMKSHEFYAGANYGQSRYLCYYLQKRGLLRKLYHSFHANQRTDPTGYRTLQAVLGEKDMAAFQKRWEQYVLKLRWR